MLKAEMRDFTRLAVLAFMHDERHPIDHLKPAVFTAFDIKDGASRFVNADTIRKMGLILVSIAHLLLTVLFR